jgi:hypothetical protein
LALGQKLVAGGYPVCVAISLVKYVNVFPKQAGHQSERAISSKIDAFYYSTQFNHPPYLQKRVKIQAILLRKRNESYLLFLL